MRAVAARAVLSGGDFGGGGFGDASAGPAYRRELDRRIRRDAPGVLAVDSAHVSDLVERRPLGLSAADAGS